MFRSRLTKLEIVRREVQLSTTTQSRFLPTPIIPPTLVVNVAKLICLPVLCLSTKLSKST